MDVNEKLRLLADASRYDLSCACGTKTNEDHRRRGGDGMWLYPVSLPGGGTSIMLKTLLASVCVNDCLYCPLRCGRDIRRTILAPEEIARVFMDYVVKRQVFGLFLSSAVVKNPDYTMERMIAAARILRKKYAYRGYIHLKVMPGASDSAIEASLSLASAVSMNVEAPKPSAFLALSGKKNFGDIVSGIKKISELTSKGSRFEKVRQTTQFIVGAAGEKDADIVKASYGLYKRLGLDRVYYSAYQRGLGDPSLFGEQDTSTDLLTREHRLYQVDFLIRRYKWNEEDIYFEDGNLPINTDPKEYWAVRHPGFFPVPLLSADYYQLLRVPGIGPATAKRIISTRKTGILRSPADAGMKEALLRKALPFICMS